MKKNTTAILVPPDVLEYHKHLGVWVKLQIPKEKSQQQKYYDYDVRIPTKKMFDWLEECCHGSYKLNIFGSQLYVYFEHDMMAVQFKLSHL
jgi:hypothetical protein